MKYYIISGEASGDLHAANLVRHLMQSDTQAQVRAWGGPLLRQAGACVVKDYSETAYMGFVEVLTHADKIMRNFSFCKKDILAYAPDVVILVDYPGFNLRIAKFLHEHHLRVFYYISPQVWAWKKNRVHAIRKYVDEMFVILPFEQQFYAQHNMKVHYFGHPLLDVVKQACIDARFKERHSLSNKPVIAVLPGSRRQEILRMLPTMLKVASQYDTCQIVIAGVEHHKNLYTPYEQEYKVKVVYNSTYDLLHCAHVALVTSGTATLETALFNVPQVVCYKANYLSYVIAKHLIKGISYISLVNLIADAPVVTELIQQDMNPCTLKNETDKIMGGYCRERMLQQYAQLQYSMGNGEASMRIAEQMVKLLEKK